MILKKLFNKLFVAKAWKAEWLKELNDTLNEAQAGLPANVVVVVTRESDMYAEVLYLLSFAGLIIGSLLALMFQSTSIGTQDLISLPLLSFAAGSTLYHFRRFFLSRIAPRAVREKVLAKAKSTFLDHSQTLKGKLVLFFFSEVEREAVILASPDLQTIVSSGDLRKLLLHLSRNYNSKDPLKALGPALMELGRVLKGQLGSGSNESFVRSFKSLLGPSDRELNPIIPIIKGNKDIN